ncbi:MAG: LysR substrate-binding domain-containing protein [Candidatus Competibacterales bacterium]
MNSLTLKHLRYFFALAQTRHFSKAADACAISQPAFSLQIKQLEDLVGAPLVERTTRHVQLTDLGEKIAQRAGEVLRIVAEIGESVRAAKDELSGPFRLGVIPTVAPYLLPEVMVRVTRRLPSLELIPREAVTPQLMEELHAGALDAAIAALPISEAALTQWPLFSENFILVRPRSQAGMPVPDLAALQSLKILLLEEGHCFREQALACCEFGKENYKNIVEGSSLTTLVQLVASGIGVTLIPEMAARIESKIAEVDLVEFEDPQPSRSIGLIWRKTSPLEAHLKMLSGIVRDAAMATRLRLADTAPPKQ